MRFLFCIISVLISLSIAQAKLSEGIDTLNLDRFDFSEPSNKNGAPADFEIIFADPIGRCILGSGYNHILEIPNTPLDSVLIAPDSGYTTSYVIGEFPDPSNPILNSTFCVITSESNWGIFQILGWYNDWYMIIKWVYQDDGTRNFSTTSTRQFARETWANIKQNYR